MNHHGTHESIARFDAMYRQRGIHAQRLYPNEQLIQFIGEYYFQLPMSERSNVRILEIGSGSGANLWMLAREGFDTYGVEPSLEANRLAAEHLATKWGVSATIRQGSAESIPFEDARFDVVCDIVTLQHLTVEASVPALAEICRVLRPAGLFFSYRLSDESIMLTGGENVYLDPVTVEDIANPNMPLSGNGPTSFWSADLATRKYSQAGFEIVSIEKYRRTYQNGSQAVGYLAITAKRPS